MRPLVASVPTTYYHIRLTTFTKVNTYKICFPKDIKESAVGPVTLLPRYTHTHTHKPGDGKRRRAIQMRTVRSMVCVCVFG